ncbi:hypothetical protein LJC19_07330, partial [Oxalobacter sp. OttesenSCG-928-P03]|nr:hypothetical protein [Oxalobacter sp. OttesenSCG-928-P03]
MAIIAADAGIVEAARAIEFVLTFFERQPDAGVFVLGNAAALSCPGDSGRAGLPGRHKAVFTGAS